ncbi:sulfotransferase domain-containing protein [Agarivorans sp. TSD2052]|uniref:sulfotransferase domain-containing protein n=1 Tax=Agarivorans sp. TSD2052 TaxID=2937286 RepID=UPI00200EEB1D|nr:sulfotransferase domain-containing protein [Agarivorans sp. TSD2052]UPW20065.1 sulfotransferase domain-containing protein [Agarivorans sp. TSD2052]
MNKVIEISSYPKCGNTWLRYIIGQIFMLDPNKEIPDVHQHNYRTKEIMKSAVLKYDSYSFYKSHVLDNPNMKCDKVVLIYRNPLDVFFSSMNYFHLHKMTEQFKGGIVKNVDELVSAGELDYYFNKFCDDVGSGYFSSMLGERSNYKKYLQDAFNNDKVVSIRYEDLVDEPVVTVRNLLNKLMPNEAIELDLDIFVEVDEKTKFSNNSFFWKAKKNTHLDYLSKEQVEYFYSKNGYFNSLGYE